jgi:DMSO/TMAO reductase YedYZ molybdopterin-dependent catalytic subunit
LPLSRRQFLSSGSLVALGGAGLSSPADPEDLVPFLDYTPQFRVEAQYANPRVKCLDLRRLTSWATPPGDFFAFHQTETPPVDANAWRLRIGGMVERPREFSLAELQQWSGRQETAATLECSGNAAGPQIMNGLVSNGVWTGVPLAGLLQEAGVKPEAREVVFFGMDSETEKKFQAGNAEYSSPHGRSIPVQDALAPEPLLAFGLNGQPLPPAQGFPLRLILPGWYGMAQVKWLQRIEVIDRRYEGRHMARNYHSLRALATPAGALWIDTSITRNRLKSVVGRVTRRSAAGRFEHKVSGAAWGGGAKIETVEVQIDSGAWRPARIDERNGDAAWLLWSYDWKYAAPGRHVLVSRARNARGEIQPTRAEWRKEIASNREDNSQWPRPLIIP